MAVVDDIIACPRCRSQLRANGRSEGAQRTLLCTNDDCIFSADAFFYVVEQPVLIDFERSILSRDDFLALKGASVLPRDDGSRKSRSKLKRILFGENMVAQKLCSKMIDMLQRVGSTPRILVVGGGTIGSGLRDIYERPDVEVVGTDIYASPHTQIVADGHQLPFADESFDGVLIQAVLEHVLNPEIVVAEIYRVLKLDGLVYADTPFMQQVHEGAYDFTRFTVSGHRWLFRNFTLLSAGATAGAGTASVWSLRYLLRALTGSEAFGLALSLPFFWLRFFDGLTRKRQNNDAASGVYFFGRKAAEPIRPRDMVEFYKAQASQSRLEPA